MINLLPPIEKERIKREYRRRIFVIYALLISGAFVIGLILLLPSYFIVDILEESAETEFLILKNSEESTEREKINDELRITKERLATITEEKTRIDLYEVIEKIANFTNNTIKITSISYTRGTDENDSTLLLGGLAATRGDLLLMTNTLKDDELFNEVILPVSSLAEDENIKFNIEIKGIF